MTGRFTYRDGLFPGDVEGLVLGSRYSHGTNHTGYVYVIFTQRNEKPAGGVEDRVFAKFDFANLLSGVPVDMHKAINAVVQRRAVLWRRSV